MARSSIAIARGLHRRENVNLNGTGDNHVHNRTLLQSHVAPSGSTHGVRWAEISSYQDIVGTTTSGNHNTKRSRDNNTVSNSSSQDDNFEKKQNVEKKSTINKSSATEGHKLACTSCMQSKNIVDCIQNIHLWSCSVIRITIFFNQAAGIHMTLGYF